MKKYIKAKADLKLLLAMVFSSLVARTMSYHYYVLTCIGMARSNVPRGCMVFKARITLIGLSGSLPPMAGLFLRLTGSDPGDGGTLL